MPKTLLHFDNATITASLQTRITTSNPQLRLVEGNVHLFEFDDSVFTHALLLMGQNPNRFGYDLSHYINSAIFFFRRLNTAPFIMLVMGSSDFKRRASEDLGVGIASLFMVQSFGLLWETLAQIPQNRKLSKYTPDFIGFNSTGETFIFEAKGTTQADKVEAIMNKALGQAKSYPESAANKFGIVSYFPSGTKTFPSFTFVADPPASIADMFPPDKIHSILMHYIKVFEYSGFEETRNIYERLLSLKFREEQKEKEERGFTQFHFPDMEVDRLSAQLRETYRSELASRTKYEWRNRTFVGRSASIDVGEVSANIFMGVDLTVPEIALAVTGNIPRFESTTETTEHEKVSVFSDGTFFRIEAIAKK